MRTDEGNGVCREGGTENMERKSWWRIVLLSLLFCALSVAALAESYSILRYLDNGSAVLSLQQALNQLGYSTGGADGKYGPATKEAVEQFQRNNNLKVDGIAGRVDIDICYRDYVDESPDRIVFALTSPMMQSKPVSALQAMLNAAGYTASDGQRLNVDGKLGKRSFSAFVEFLNAHKKYIE